MGPLGTCEHQAHLLRAYSDAELKLLVEVAAGKRRSGASSAGTGIYKEVQIHGDIELKRDVEAVVVPAASPDLEVALAFGRKFETNVIVV